jgi:hypothetical protein
MDGQHERKQVATAADIRDRPCFAEQVSNKEPSYAEFLDKLLSREVDARRSRYLLVSFRTILSFIVMKKIGTRMST